MYNRTIENIYFKAKLFARHIISCFYVQFQINNGFFCQNFLHEFITFITFFFEYLDLYSYVKLQECWRFYEICPHPLKYKVDEYVDRWPLCVVHGKRVIRSDTNGTEEFPEWLANFEFVRTVNPYATELIVIQVLQEWFSRYN